MSEKPVHCRPRRLADWINPTGAKKVHSLIDKVYQRKNLEMAWETVKANRGSGGVDGQSLDEFAAQLDQLRMSTKSGPPFPANVGPGGGKRLVSRSSSRYGRKSS